MKYKLSIFLAAILSVSLISCKSSAPSDLSDRKTALMQQTADMGQEYIDSLIFLGESTTYHMKSRGVLAGGQQTTQVWAPKSGTANLDSSAAHLKIVYPQTGEEISVGEAAKRAQPKRIILTFGLNGAVQKISAGEAFFRYCYMALINAILENSPNTEIILQSCFPIAADMDVSNYSVDVIGLLECIKTINCWTHALAEDEGLGYLNTAEALCDEGGFLKKRFDAGDGYHLNTQAYLVILRYIRTHA